MLVSQYKYWPSCHHRLIGNEKPEIVRAVKDRFGGQISVKQAFLNQVMVRFEADEKKTTLAEQGGRRWKAK